MRVDDFKLTFNTLCNVRDILHQNALPQHTWKNPVSSYDLPKCFPILSIQVSNAASLTKDLAYKT